MKPKTKKKIIGSHEYINLVDYNLINLQTKIDTGAYYGAIHCTDIRIESIKGKSVLSFVLLDEKHPQYSKKTIATSNFRPVIIHSSFGEVQRRYLVKLKFSLLGQIYETYFSLADRSKMRAPVLLGKYFLRDKFLVNVNKKYQQGEVK